MSTFLPSPRLNVIHSPHPDGGRYEEILLVGITPVSVGLWILETVKDSPPFAGPLTSGHRCQF